jgi:hypothetical protein
VTAESTIAVAVGLLAGVVDPLDDPESLEHPASAKAAAAASTRMGLEFMA